MPVAVIVCFMVLFALTMFAASVGQKFYDARQKKHVVDMLQTAVGEERTPTHFQPLTKRYSKVPGFPIVHQQVNRSFR